MPCRDRLAVPSESYLRPLLGYPLIEKRCSAAEGCDLNVGPQPDGRKAILRTGGRLQSPSVSRMDVQVFPDSLLLLIAWVVSLLPALELNRQLSRFNLLTTAMSFAGTFVATSLVQMKVSWLDRAAVRPYSGRYQGQRPPTPSQFEHGDV
jgi:hypothetical protein